jgi:hypothetical protein
MAANSSISLTSLDFDSYKRELKAFLKQQSAFKDYDYESSNMNVMLDLLAYNTYQNAFYMNMIGNEMFLDTAQLRDSVVSHAKELNYLPRSFKSAEASLALTIVSADAEKRNVVIPKGTAFSTRVGANTYLFTTAETSTVTSSNSTFTTTLTVYEGDYVSETYPVSYTTPTKFLISNKNVDISSLKVTIMEDNGATLLNYTRATSLFELSSTSKVFFIQPYIGDTYEILFGDGIIGRRPKNDSVIVIEYRISSGELPNGARVFRAAQTIDGESNVTVRTATPASGGAVYETLESIKYNAPRAFTTQERAVTAEDYENLLKINFPEINAVAAYGGEDAEPPQYGRVFVSVDLKDVDGLPKIKENEYKRFLRNRATVAMEPVFISPQYLYLSVVTNIKYNINVTPLNPDDIKTLVLSKILEFASTNLNNFNRTLRYSKFVKTIDEADSSIISNETEIKLVKYLTPTLNVPQKIAIDYNIPIIDSIPMLGDEHFAFDNHAIESSTFIFNGKQCNIEDNSIGIIRITTVLGQSHQKVVDIGTIDYELGKIDINGLRLSGYTGDYLKIYATPKYKDISTSKNTILNILEPDVEINVEQVRE